MTLRMTQSTEQFHKRKISGMWFSRSATASTQKEAREQARKWRNKGILVRILKAKCEYELYTR